MLPGGSISDSSVTAPKWERGSGGKSVYQGLEKGECNTMQHSFYKRLFLSHEGPMSPIRDLVLHRYEEMQGLRT